MKKILIVLLSTFFVNILADDFPNIFHENFKIDISWLEKQNKSYAKDFYIIQYLNQEDTLLQDAVKAYEMSNENNKYVKSAFKEKYLNINEEDKKCYNLSIEELLQLEDQRCIALGLSLNEAVKLPKNILDKFVKKLNNYPALQNNLIIIRNEDFSNEDLPYGINKYFDFFFNLGYVYRIDNFDKIYSEDFINKLSYEKDFEMFVRYTIYDKLNLQNLQKSLLNTKDNLKLTSNVLFLLGINALNHQREDLAFYFFEKAYKKSYKIEEKDKILFWLYLVTSNSSFLYELSNSKGVNIYSLYAKEIYNFNIENLVYDVQIENTPSPFNIYNQFLWMDVLGDIKNDFNEEKLNKYKEVFTSKQTLPQLAFLLTRYNKHQIYYYITPFEDELKDYDNYKKILIYSIARQESHFIPSSISSATALGVMQIMPFLSKKIAEELNENYNIYEQFIPKKNIHYASYHLDKLAKVLDNNPLFIAYAYNGGLGYLRSQFKKGLFSNKNGKFEPFLSMEMISYPETKEYGKKVLTNYYIYNNFILNPENKINLSTIFQSLVVPN